ncbi:carbohydrate ABC transporter permease [Pelagibacterium halotolerans]|uniref:Binding-protein-dependent transport systems inner membrane component n=1 Tax=Pelagibacterium halotolerans (strain DSM 22347 / JCM 15775 / CGMCC 1.7692 / B2) TaxID=1082931 RepID=G4R758_PELHB|nr:carbohydrate ABC transporter permease [Pelagibacterium halotolerans]AEQ50212.1 binding-protein-dependent transport systems inner membrane component [Pelagibacterium halotolerans B2]QJR19787.1 carbohydrate ABC transporter permease [Pelagibacterium halotolerans]SEA50774.1 putative aldouronate transport system permease protein [Pelagibacterium halotolerans]
MTRANSTRFERLEQTIIVSSLLLMVVVTVQPILNLLAISFSDSAQVPGMSGLAVVPRGFSLDVWTLLIANPEVQRGLLNSLFITITGTILNVTFTALMAWALSRPRLPGRRILFVFVLATIVFEPGLIPDYFVVRELGLLNTYWAVILYKLVNAWYLIILIRFFEEVPGELLEAAELDGANAFQTLWKVVLPLTMPALATITLFYLVYHWNEFLRPMIYLNDSSMHPLQVVLRKFVLDGDKSSMVGLAAMSNYQGAAQISTRALNAGMIMLTILPILAVYPLILKFFTKGTMSGALKG